MFTFKSTRALFLLTAVLTSLLFYQNFTAFDYKTQKIMENISRIDRHLKSTSMSEKAKDVLLAHKMYLAGKISKHLQLQTCGDVKSQIPSAGSGVYYFNSLENILEFRVVYCDFAPGAVQQSVLVEKMAIGVDSKALSQQVAPPPAPIVPLVPVVQPAPVVAVGYFGGAVKTQPTKATCASDEKATYRKDRSGTLILYCSERNGGDNDR